MNKNKKIISTQILCGSSPLFNDQHQQCLSHRVIYQMVCYLPRPANMAFYEQEQGGYLILQLFEIQNNSKVGVSHLLKQRRYSSRKLANFIDIQVAPRNCFLTGRQTTSLKFADFTELHHHCFKRYFSQTWPFY